jgi:hypothetical protein
MLATEHVFLAGKRPPAAYYICWMEVSQCFLSQTQAWLFQFSLTSLPAILAALLTGASGQTIKCLEECETSFSFQDHEFECTLCGRHTAAILGADFLRRFRLVIDLVAGQLLDSKNMEQFRPKATVGGMKFDGLYRGHTARFLGTFF